LAVESMKKIIICMVALGIMLGAGYLYLNSYVKYVPVVLPHDDADYPLTLAPKLNTAKHKENLKIVLENACEDFKVINGEIYIKRKAAMNKEAIWSLTSSANKPDFIKEAKKSIEQWAKLKKK
jgi:hypothetical protein